MGRPIQSSIDDDADHPPCRRDIAITGASDVLMKLGRVAPAAGSIRNMGGMPRFGRCNGGLMIPTSDVQRCIVPTASRMRRS